MRLPASLLLSACSAALVFVGSAARAQAPVPPNPAADAAFHAGRDAAKAGDWATAYAKFNEAQRLQATRGTLLNIADCEEHLGRLVAAHEHFDEVAAAFPVGDERHTIAATRAAAVERHIAHVTLRLAPSAPAGTVVTEGGAAVDPAKLGMAIASDPGTVTVVVSAAGHADRRYPLVIGDGATLDQTLDVGAALATASTSSPAPAVATDALPPPTVNKTKRTLGLVLGGAGVVSLGVGAVAGILAAGKASTVKDHCTATYACDPEGLSAGNAGQVLAPLSTVTLIAGAALVGAGAWFFFTSKSSGKPAQSAFLPLVSPSGGGAAWVQAF